MPSAGKVTTLSSVRLKKRKSCLNYRGVFQPSLYRAQFKSFQLSYMQLGYMQTCSMTHDSFIKEILNLTSDKQDIVLFAFLLQNSYLVIDSSTTLYKIRCYTKQITELHNYYYGNNP